MQLVNLNSEFSGKIGQLNGVGRRGAVLIELVERDGVTLPESVGVRARPALRCLTVSTQSATYKAANL